MAVSHTAVVGKIFVLRICHRQSLIVHALDLLLSYHSSCFLREEDLPLHTSLSIIVFLTINHNLFMYGKVVSKVVWVPSLFVRILPTKMGQKAHAIIL